MNEKLLKQLESIKIGKCQNGKEEADPDREVEPPKREGSSANEGDVEERRRDARAGSAGREDGGRSLP